MPKVHSIAISIERERESERENRNENARQKAATATAAVAATAPAWVATYTHRYKDTIPGNRRPPLTELEIGAEHLCVNNDAQNSGISAMCRFNLTLAEDRNLMIYVYVYVCLNIDIYTGWSNNRHEMSHGNGILLPKFIHEFIYKWLFVNVCYEVLINKTFRLIKFIYDVWYQTSS